MHEAQHVFYVRAFGFMETASSVDLSLSLVHILTIAQKRRNVKQLFDHMTGCMFSLNYFSFSW